MLKYYKKIFFIYSEQENKLSKKVYLFIREAYVITCFSSEIYLLLRIPKGIKKYAFVTKSNRASSFSYDPHPQKTDFLKN